ncbi:bile-acid 7-alpha-dehydratase [Mycolicibacterium litorale]|uniref:Bile-acid 7-alpha-dehydratase n=1 Tax=Mycolicibacterium litorale TaxID=758802 RepID=A0A6S6PBU4_9MYCO|nr:nuclear transport factor 2 family protein [Mycolicibacterium litorale]BCI55925.1 bile-acid 7-alpha-dehydratase [Mycolicibacterium litorale]
MTDAFFDLTQAKARYCYTLDARDWAGFAALMTEDIELDVSEGTGVPVVHGRDAAVDMIRSSLTNARSAHQVHTPLIEVDGDQARVVWAMQDRVVWENGPALTGYGHYHERWVRGEDGWKLAALRLTRLIMEFQSAD